VSDQVSHWAASEGCMRAMLCRVAIIEQASGGRSTDEGQAGDADDGLGACRIEAVGSREEAAHSTLTGAAAHAIFL
jgi:hypothetical protein